MCQFVYKNPFPEKITFLMFLRKRRSCGGYRFTHNFTPFCCNDSFGVATFFRTVFTEEISKLYPTKPGKIILYNLRFHPLDSDQSTAQTARDLGVNPNSLYSWMAKYSNYNKNNQKNMTGNANYFEEIKSVKKELSLFKQECDLLKKAAAKFAKESR
jgi:transposase